MTHPLTSIGPPPSHIEDFTGRQFGDVVVLGYGGHERVSGTWQHLWIARCSCGHTWKVQTGNLRKGAVHRCLGCARKRMRTAPLARTHGQSGTVEYRLWFHMCQRCSNRFDPCYPNYGGRGIMVCRRWVNSFQNFISDMGPRPSLDHYITRINQDRSFSPGNCQWGPQQRAGDRVFTIGEETGNMADWGRRLGISRERIRQRLLKHPPEVALTAPKGRTLEG